MKPIVIAAGGTGGHFFPAEALAACLIARNERVVLFTDARSGGLASPVFAHAERHVLAGGGLAGKGMRRAAAGALGLARGTLEARALLSRLAPGAVVAFGGYPSVPPVLAARMVGRRPAIILHEQNAVLGRANRVLARLADHLALSIEGTTRVPPGIATGVIGNPVRPAIAAIAGAGYAPPGETIELLVLGGSLGAKVFGTLIPEAIALLPASVRARLRLTMQVRADDLEGARAVLARAGVEATLAPFFTDVAALLARAHLVIGRAGASTVAELAVVGRPAILIPLPNAIDDHQRANAEALARIGAAWREDQAGLTPAALAVRLESLLADPAGLTKAAAAAAAHGRANAAERLADLVLSHIHAGVLP